MQGDADAWAEVATVFDAGGHPARIGALLGVYHDEPMTNIADAAGIQRQSLQPHLEKLVEAGLVYRPVEQQTYAVTPLGRFIAVFIEDHLEIFVDVMAAIEEGEDQAREELRGTPENALSAKEFDRAVQRRKWELVQQELEDLLSERVGKPDDTDDAADDP